MNENKINLNLGCNTTKIPGFVGIDHRQTSATDVVADVFALNLRFQTNTVDTIFAAHILEHASFDRTLGILRQWHNLLKPGGLLYVVVPDFSKVTEFWLREYRADRTTWEFFNSRIFGNAEVAKKMYGGDPADYEQAFHKAVFNVSMLERMLRAAGFKAYPYQVFETPAGAVDEDKEICVKGEKCHV